MKYLEQEIDVTLRKNIQDVLQVILWSFNELLSIYGKISYQEYVSEGISHPVFCVI